MSNPKDLVGAKKAPLGYVPAAAVLGPAPAMAIGAAKYGPFNWREQPVQAMIYVEAVLRHLFAWIDGQDDAEDTGISHIGHAQAGLAILADAIAAGNVIDNRPAKGPAADMLRAQDRSVAPVESHTEGLTHASISGYVPVSDPCGYCGTTFDQHALACFAYDNGGGMTP